MTDTIQQFTNLQENTLMATLGIKTLEISAERVVARMEVSPQVHQPFGLLRGVCRSDASRGPRQPRRDCALHGMRLAHLSFDRLNNPARSYPEPKGG